MTIRWTPATAANIVLYVLLYSDTGTDGPFVELAQIPNVPMGPNWDMQAALFVYDDLTNAGAPYRLYRMSTVDTLGAVYIDTTSPPFSDNNDPYTLPVHNTQVLDSNYGGVGALMYITPEGVPVDGATVRVYTQADWDAQNYTRVVGLVRTLPTGEWSSPILVEPGNTYVLQYHLPNVFGPDTTTVIV